MHKYINKNDTYSASIEEDSEVGFYLYIFELKSGKCLFDSLQDTLEIAKNQAQRDFSLNSDAWVEIT